MILSEYIVSISRQIEFALFPVSKDSGYPRLFSIDNKMRLTARHLEIDVFKPSFSVKYRPGIGFFLSSQRLAEITCHLLIY